MRIGNLEDLEQSEKSEELITMIQSNHAENLTKPQKWKNWWHYYKWYVICGAVLIGIVCNIIGNALGLWEKPPDFQVAYVGKIPLPQDTAEAIEEAFSCIGTELFGSLSNIDFNGDKQAVVRLNQYISGGQSTDMDAVSYEYTSEVALIGDISDCESYFFLLDDPDSFQQEFQLLASPDGSCPKETDFSVDGKVILWSDCPALEEIAAWAEEKAPGSKELLSRLYIGRRCFYTDAMTDNTEKCSELWDLFKRDVSQTDTP